MPEIRGARGDLTARPRDRAGRSGEVPGVPADPQHPAEEAIDALRGAVRTLFPEGRIDPARFRRHDLRTGACR
jgi:hypothetical protein